MTVQFFRLLTIDPELERSFLIPNLVMMTTMTVIKSHYTITQERVRASLPVHVSRDKFILELVFFISHLTPWFVCY